MFVFLHFLAGLEGFEGPPRKGGGGVSLGGVHVPLEGFGEGLAEGFFEANLLMVMVSSCFLVCVCGSCGFDRRFE